MSACQVDVLAALVYGIFVGVLFGIRIVPSLVEHPKFRKSNTGFVHIEKKVLDNITPGRGLVFDADGRRFIILDEDTNRDILEQAGMSTKTVTESDAPFTWRPRA